MTSKRKRNDLTLAEKYEAVRLIEMKTLQTEIAKKLGCSQAQVSNISKNKEAIKIEFLANSNPQRKRHRCGKAEDVEDALTQWFIEAKKQSTPLSGLILTEKAADLARNLQKDNFSPTNGWLSRWKERNNFVMKRMGGENKDADERTPKQWIDTALPKEVSKFLPPAGLDDEESSNFVSHDDYLSCSNVRTDQEICADFRPSPEHNNDAGSNDDDERIPIDAELPVSASEAREALNTLFSFYAQKQCNDFNPLYQVGDTCERLIEKSCKQTEMSEFIDRNSQI